MEHEEFSDRVFGTVFFHFPRAMADIFWSFFPVFIVLLVLWLTGGLQHFSERSDLLLASSMVFADGARRLYGEQLNRPPWERSRLRPSPTTGVVGALIAVILISLILMSEGADFVKLREIVASSRFQTTQLAVLALSFIYGLRVRMMLFRDEEWKRNLGTS